MKIARLATALVALALPAHATLITYEGFDYAPGNLDGLDGGTAWTTAWATQSNTTNYAVQTGSLSYGSLETTGNSVLGGGAFTRTGRRMATGFGSAWDNAGYVSEPFGAQQLDQGNVWASFAIRRDAAVPSWDSLGVFFHREFTGWAYSEANTSLGITYNGSNWQAGGVNLNNSDLGDTVLFVVKWELSTTGTNSIYIWQNPLDLNGPDLSTATANASITGLTTEQARFRSVAFYSGNTAGATSIDEIRLGTSFASVTPIPEPSVMAFAFIALLVTVTAHARLRRSRPGAALPA